MAEERKELLLRVPTEVWEAARERAHENRTNVTVEINRALELYLRMRSAAGITDVPRS